MPHVRLILALHNHQPVGNFSSVFEEAYRTSYLPFLETLERHPQIPFALHTSGPLIEWLVDNRPDYIDRLRARAAAGMLEIIGGGFQEPILTMIPPRDRIGQIRSFSQYLTDLFDTPVRGLWLAERVWEQSLVSSIADAGAQYVILDDAHFERAGVPLNQLTGYYLTEDDGRLLRAFPAAETLRYTMPFQPPHATYLFLRSIAEQHESATVVFADDGEKFGAWPKTYEHVYKNGWLESFCQMLEGNREWLEPALPARVIDQTLPLGKIYLPDGSYREMTEWALDVEAARAYRAAAERLGKLEGSGEIQRFFRPGGFWRNFKARYPESDEMYARMLLVSRRLEAVENEAGADPDYLEIARRELYRGQCNCPYWHGSFGGLYLPHLRGAIYQALITADAALDDAEGGRPEIAIDAADYNLDGRQEVRLENGLISVFVRPALGGHVYELDDRRTCVNLLATLERRPEVYHDAIRKAASSGSNPAAGEVLIKDQGLDSLLVYDRLPRKTFVDHFFKPGTTLADLVAEHDQERGDFATGVYHSRLRREPGRVALCMERSGRAGDHLVRIKKTLALAANSSTLEAVYELEDLPADTPLLFAVEINLAGMAGHAGDRLYLSPQGDSLGMLDAQLELADTRGIILRDDWRNLQATLSWSISAGLWCFPIETVSLSEGGCERVYQSSAVIPHFQVVAGAESRCRIVIQLGLEPARSAATLEQRLSQPSVATQARAWS